MTKHKHRDGWNRHHLLYQAKNWDSKYAKLLRIAMTREIPVDIHNELHATTLQGIPKPAEKVLKNAWEAYESKKTIVDTLDIKELILWLFNAIPDEAFRACMMVQYRFFDGKAGGG